MPGGREPPPDRQSDADLWARAIGSPWLPALMLTATFVGTSPDPAGRVWLARGGMAAFLALIAWLVSVPRLRERRRRRRRP